MLSVTVMLSLLAGGCFLNQSGYEEGIADWCRENVDFAAIRVWEKTVTVSGSIPPRRRPPAIRQLAPQYITVDKAESKVTLIWGGGFRHWGIDIGPPTMQSPETTMSAIKIVMPIQPGVYYWSE